MWICRRGARSDSIRWLASVCLLSLFGVGVGVGIGVDPVRPVLGRCLADCVPPATELRQQRNDSVQQDFRFLVFFSRKPATDLQHILDHTAFQG